MSKATTKEETPKLPKTKTVKAAASVEITPQGAVEILAAHFDQSPDYRQSVQNALESLLFTEVKAKVIRRDKSSISTDDLKEIIRVVTPKIINIFRK